MSFPKWVWSRGAPKSNSVPFTFVVTSPPPPKKSSRHATEKGGWGWGGLNKGPLYGLTSLQEPWPGIVCVSQGTDTERQREMGRRAHWHSGANSNRDLGQASSRLWHWVNHGRNNKDRLCGQAFCWLLATLCKNACSLRVFIRQAAEANVPIAKAQRTSQILVFINDVKHPQIYWTKAVTCFDTLSKYTQTLICDKGSFHCFNSPLHLVSIVLPSQVICLFFQCAFLFLFFF